MEYKLRQLLNLSDEEIKNSKIELNMYKGEEKTRLINIWLLAKKRDKLNGTCMECSYWPRYGKAQSNFKVGQKVFSFVRIKNDNWLFVSAGVAMDIPQKGKPKIKIIKEYKPLFGRLIIKLKKGQTYSRITFNLNKYINKAYVKEILATMYCD